MLIKGLELNCYNTKLIFQEINILRIVNSLIKIRHFGFSSCKNLTNSTINLLMLPQNNISHLNLDFSLIDDRSFDIISLFSSQLNKLSLQFCKRITKNGLFQLFSKPLDNLKFLSLRGIECFGKKCINQLIENAKNLNILLLHNNIMSDFKICLIMNSMINLHYLEISKLIMNKNLTSFIFQNLNRMNCNLKTIDLSFNEFITDQSLIEMLKFNCKIEKLVLKSCNNITLKSIKFCSEVLKNSLRIFNLKYIKFNEEDLHQIFEIFKNFNFLSFVHMTIPNNFFKIINNINKKYQEKDSNFIENAKRRIMIKDNEENIYFFLYF